MNERDHELFEAELHRLVPAPLPPVLRARLAASVPRPSPLALRPSWSLLFRWLAPAAVAAALVAALLVCWPQTRDGGPQAKPVTASPKAAPKADEIEIDRQLVALFDAVAQLPGGQPVRFRCREWADEVVFRDPARGLVIEHRTPRLEVVPVSFEIY
jgi:hypothetical protein